MRGRVNCPAPSLGSQLAKATLRRAPHITKMTTSAIGICSRDGCGRELSLVHGATGIDAEGRIGPLWTCKDHRTELWMKVAGDLVAPMEWWPDRT